MLQRDDHSLIRAQLASWDSLKDSIQALDQVSARIGRLIAERTAKPAAPDAKPDSGLPTGAEPVPSPADTQQRAGEGPLSYLSSHTSLFLRFRHFFV